MGQSRGDQRRFQLRCLPLRVQLGEDGGGAGQMRSRHRRPRQRDIGVAYQLPQLGALRPGGGDVDPRAGDVRLDGEVTQAGAGAGEVGEQVVAVYRTHSQRPVRRTRICHSE